jgi:hypothetical protein
MLDVRGNWYVYADVLLLEHARGSHNLPTHIGLSRYVFGASHVEYQNWNYYLLFEREEKWNFLKATVNIS